MNPNSPVLEEYVPHSNSLYFIFGGMKARMGMPPFEFFRSSQIIRHNKIFFRDFSQMWYQNGLPGIGKNVFDICRFIEKKIDDIAPRHVYFVGNSMGGFAAILFASLVKQGKVIAFAPQTFITPIKRLRFRDKRWNRQVLKNIFHTFHKQHIWDVKEVLSENNSNIHIDIFVSKKYQIDYIHAGQLRCFKNVRIFEFEVGGHDLVKFLKDQGDLPSILLGGYNT